MSKKIQLIFFLGIIFFLLAACNRPQVEGTQPPIDIEVTLEEIQDTDIPDQPEDTDTPPQKKIRHHNPRHPPKIHPSTCPKNAFHFSPQDLRSACVRLSCWTTSSKVIRSLPSPPAPMWALGSHARLCRRRGWTTSLKTVGRSGVSPGEISLHRSH